jgi:hypothetical protein
MSLFLGTHIAKSACRSQCGQALFQNQLAELQYGIGGGVVLSALLDLIRFIGVHVIAHVIVRVAGTDKI